MRPRGIAIVAKPPEPGRSKTRLTPPLSEEQAARLSAAFLRDVLLAAHSIDDAEVCLVVPECSDTGVMRSLTTGPVSFLEESGSGLGDAQRLGMDAMLDSGSGSVVVVGGDLPTLSGATLEMALDCLEAGDCDVVLGPADDGGYYLIGARRPIPELFENIEWGTERVLQQTVKRASETGLSVKHLAQLSDVDTYEDLERLIRDLGLRGDLEAPATRRTLRELRSDGARIPPGPTPWELLGQSVELETPWRSLVVDRVRTHAGDELDWHYLSAPDPVIVVPVTPDGDVVLIRQYRQPLRDWSLEVPAGSGSGTFDEVARTELREEIGAAEIGHLEYLGSWHPMTGHASTLVHFYLALGVVPGEPQLERNELLTPYPVPAEIAIDMARRGEITDGACALAILICEPQIRSWLAHRMSG